MAWSTPATWTAVQATVNQMNTRIRDQFNALGDPWTAYTPAWTATVTNPAILNGTIEGRYREIGKTIDYEIHILMGSTTTFGSGNYIFTLPPPPSRTTSSGWPMGTATIWDTNVLARLTRFPKYNSTTTVFLDDVAGTIVGATVPFTWANTDRLVIAGSYESA